MDFVESKLAADNAYFLDGALYSPQGGVVRLIGASTPQLVVEDDATRVGGQFRHVYNVIVRNARPTMYG